MANISTGKNTSMGPALVNPSNDLPQPHWKAAVMTPEGGADRQQVHDRRHQRDQQAAEDHHQQQEGQDDHHPDELGHLAGQDVGEVLPDGGHPADVDVEGAAGFGCRARRRADGAADGSSGRPGAAWSGRRSPPRPCRWGWSGAARTAATPGSPCSDSTKAAKRALVSRAVHLADDLQGAVEPGSEALRQQVVRLAGGGRGRRRCRRRSSPSRRLKNGRASTTMTARATTLRIRRRPSEPSAQRSQKPCSRSSWGPCPSSRRRSPRRSAFMP